eukprot:17066-Rhodomonas_salina.3
MFVLYTPSSTATVVLCTAAGTEGRYGGTRAASVSSYGVWRSSQRPSSVSTALCSYAACPVLLRTRYGLSGTDRRRTTLGCPTDGVRVSGYPRGMCLRARYAVPRSTDTARFILPAPDSVPSGTIA